MAESLKQSIQEYVQLNSVMGGSRNSQDTQFGIGQTLSTTTRSMLAERRVQLFQSWNEEVFSLIDQALLMCEIFVPSTSSSARVLCVAAIKTENDRENRKMGSQVQTEEPYPFGKLQSTRGHIQTNDQLHSQIRM